MLLTAFHGLCMALADSVPGVSGGTIAFILGFYEDFLDALHSLFARDRGAHRAAVRYLCKLGLGWAAGMAGSVLLLDALFTRQIYFLSSLFLGLTAASLPFVLREERQTLRGHRSGLLYAALGAFCVAALSLLRGSGGSAALDYAALQPLQYPYLFVSGMIAITAMVLPGISGSTLLLIFGVYLPTINAAKQFLTFQFAVVPGLTALGLGMACGVALSISLIRTALARFRPQMIALILGLMLGSLYAIALGPTTLAEPQPALSAANFQPVGFGTGVALLLALEALRSATGQGLPARRVAGPIRRGSDPPQ